MIRNNEEKSLTKIKGGVFNKVISFFRNLFKKKKIKEQIILSVEPEDVNFKENIKIEKDQEKDRILKLQKKFKEGEIQEEDISEDDYIKLVELYEEQNEKLRKEIEMYKIETAKILKQKKNM